MYTLYIYYNYLFQRFNLYIPYKITAIVRPLQQNSDES